MTNSNRKIFCLYFVIISVIVTLLVLLSVLIVRVVNHEQSVKGKVVRDNTKMNEITSQTLIETILRQIKYFEKVINFLFI